MQSTAFGPSGALEVWATDGAAVTGPIPRRLRILVVDDDPIIAMLLGELLAAMGHEVCGIADDEAGAVASAALYEPDLMIVDTILGQGSGVGAVDAAATARPSPHIFTSGDALSVQRLKPAAVVLQKPYNEADLTAAIRRAT
jgi:CheY-like chemotaxis protein